MFPIHVQLYILTAIVSPLTFSRGWQTDDLTKRLPQVSDSKGREEHIDIH